MEPNRRPNMRGATRRRERRPSPEPWMLPLVHPPFLKLPTQQPREQTSPDLVQAREEREVETEITEGGVDTTVEERKHGERSTGLPESARTPSTTATVSEKADWPRRETRRPTRYDAFECYTLQPQRMHTGTNSENYLTPMIRKTCIEQQKGARNREYLEGKANAGKNEKNKELFYCAQEGPLV